MSNWDLADYFEQEDAGGNPRKGVWKYTKWANPFKNYEQEIETLACEGELLATFKMFGLAAGNMFFTQFLPSPVEILRKTVAGSYKCGFYLGIKFKSPLEVLFRSRKLGVALGKINAVGTTPLFYMWVAQTFWAFLDSWTSIIHAMYRCGADANTCIAGIMVTPLSIDGDHEGVVAAGLDIYDPNHWHEGLAGQIHVPEGLNSTCTIALNIASFNCQAASVQFYLGTGEFPGGPIMMSDGFGIGANEDTEVYLSGSRPAGGPTHWRCGLIVKGLQKTHPLGRIDIGCVRMVVRSDERELPCTSWKPGLPAVASSG